MSRRMLFEPERHEPLCDTAWDASRALEAIRSIVHDIEQSRVADGRWRVHPLEDEDDPPRTGFKSLYLGSAGVVWALWYLQREGAVELTGNLQIDMQHADAAYLAEPDTGTVVPSYFLGEVGVLLVLWRLTGSDKAADRLYHAVRSNIPNPTNEALWAAPGTMVAAWHLWEATGEQRWREMFLENVEQLWRTWILDEKAQCHLWTQDLYGKVVQYLGAGHGFAGNVFLLLKGASLLDADRREKLYERCVATLRATKKVDEEGAINWPAGTFKPRPGRTGMLMQWCHGAPGVVTALADFPEQQSTEMEAMLIGAGDAVWKAGPLTKGYGLCHGTAGNGYAFLKLLRRTGDRLWLQRARSFAMHSIEQHDRMRQRYGHGRYTLWTGDAGLAVYLWHCSQGLAALPALDIV
jgi:lantibiotic modifying enzyme